MKSIKAYLDYFQIETTFTIRRFKKDLYHVPETIREFVDKNKHRPYAAGMHLGRQEKNTFKPSAAFLNYISQHTNKKITVTPKVEWLFVCNRDIFEDKIQQEHKPEGLVLVQNKHGENLGLAVRKGNIYKNLFDIGNFLRRE